MKCPVCNATLLMSDKQGVEVDYCPECRGVWLDRGELEKILSRMQPENEPRQNPPQNYDKNFNQEKYQKYPTNYQRKKKSKFEFLTDIFEFGD